MCGSALTNKGVQLVLDAVVDYLPSPLDVNEGTITGSDEDDLEKRDANTVLNAFRKQV